MSLSLKNALPVFSTLAFVIPGPFGVCASAALQALGLMLPNDGKNPMLDAIQQCVTDIENFITLHQLKVDGQFVTSITGWITTVNAIADLNTNPAQLQNQIDAITKDVDGPTPTIDLVLNDLVALFSNPDNTKPFFDTAHVALVTYVNLRIAVAQLLSLKLGFQQQLAEIYLASSSPADQAKAAKAQNQVEALYDSLYAYVAGKSFTAAQSGGYICSADALTSFQSWIGAIRTARLSQIGTVQEYTDGWTSTYYFYYTDSGVPGGSLLGRQDYTLFSPGFHGVGFHLDTRSKTMAAVQADLASYVAKVKKELDDFEAEVLDVPQQGKKILAAAPRVPSAPASAPDVTFVDSGWKGAWQSPGKYICYSYRLLYADPPGRSSPSPVGPVNGSGQPVFVQCPADTSQVPMVTIPPDPTGFTKARMLVRTVADDANGLNRADNDVSCGPLLEFYDVWPVQQGDVCPTPLYPPIARAQNFANNQSGRTWPDPYRVRYRYCYINKQGKSLAYSPWSVAEALSGYDTDTDGYLFHQGYYSLQFIVPYQEGCGFELQRQFKGQPVRTIKSWASQITDASGTVINTQMYNLRDDEGP